MSNPTQHVYRHKFLATNDTFSLIVIQSYYLASEDLDYNA